MTTPTVPTVDKLKLLAALTPDEAVDYGCAFMALLENDDLPEQLAAVQAWLWTQQQHPRLRIFAGAQRFTD